MKCVIQRERTRDYWKIIVQVVKTKFRQRSQTNWCHFSPRKSTRIFNVSIIFNPLFDEIYFFWQPINVARVWKLKLAQLRRRSSLKLCNWLAIGRSCVAVLTVFTIQLLRDKAHTAEKAHKYILGTSMIRESTQLISPGKHNINRLPGSIIELKNVSSLASTEFHRLQILYQRFRDFNEKSEHRQVSRSFRKRDTTSYNRL